MAVRRKIRVASDTGPLISAFQVSRSDLLNRYFETIIVPPSVLAELIRHGFEPQSIAERERGLLVVELLTPEETERAIRLAERIAASPLTTDASASNHRPEAEAMVLAQRAALRIERLLLEERAGRAIAQAEGIAITGFVGVLLLACEEGLLQPSEIRLLLNDCRRQGTYYAQAFIDAVCQMAEELSP